MNTINSKTLIKNYSFYGSSLGRDFEFECPDKWFDLIMQLSEEIKNQLELEHSTLTVYQVKDKTGSLIFNCASCSREVRGIINKYESASKEIK